MGAEMNVTRDLDLLDDADLRARDDLAMPGANRWLRVAAVWMAVALLLAGWQAVGASADTVADLRGDTPTGDEVRAELAEIAQTRIDSLARLTSAETELTQLLADRDRLGDEERRLVAEMDALLLNLRRLAVQTFISGGQVGNLEYFLDVSDASDFAWRQYLIRTHAGSSQAAVERLQLLRSQASDTVLTTITRADELRAELDELEAEMATLDEQEELANAVLIEADAWDRVAVAVAEGGWGIAPADQWAQLRMCESTNNYQATNPSGKYRGAYQFDLATWQTVGGTGDPAAASPHEQDARARELYARRGHQPWPECGRFLR